MVPCQTPEGRGESLTLSLACRIQHSEVCDPLSGIFIDDDDDDDNDDDCYLKISFIYF